MNSCIVHLPHTVLKSKRRVIEIISYFLLFFIIFADSAYYAVNILSGATRLLINIMIVVVSIAIMLIKRSKIHKTKLLAYIILLLIVLCSHILNFNTDLKQTIIILICITAGFSLSIIININNLIIKFNAIVLFLSTWSLVAYLTWFLFPSIINKFPVIGIREGAVYYNLIFSVCNNQLPRNFGIFWEPGAFAAFLCISLFFLLFKSDKLKIRNIVIITVCIITTMSTMGIIAMVFLYIAYFSYHPIKIDQKRKKMIAIIMILLIIALLFLPTSFYTQTFDKLFKLDNSGNTYETTQVRLDAIIYMTKEFFSAPVIGIGIGKFIEVQREFCHNMATATPLNWLASYGIIFGVITTGGYLGLFIDKNRKKITNILIISFALIIILTENFMQISFIYLLIFSGLGRDKHENIPVHGD